MKVNMLEAKNQLSKLVKAAVEGEDVVIANNGKPVVRLVRIMHAKTRRKPGAWRKLAGAAGDWDSPVTDRLLARALVGRRFP
jgi:prevent-host-death family protein